MKLPRPSGASRAAAAGGPPLSAATSPTVSPSAPPATAAVTPRAGVVPVARKAPTLKMVGQPSPITAEGPPGPTHWVLRLKSKAEFHAALTKYQQCVPPPLTPSVRVRVSQPRERRLCEAV
jgi:hypothetical protein